jgi:egghead protein (zeste-white 4 protein)
VTDAPTRPRTREPFPDLTAPAGHERAARPRTSRRHRQPDDLDVLTIQSDEGIPVRKALQARQASLEYVAWRPRFTVLVLAFAVLAVYSLWSFSPNRTPLGWALSVVWSMPIVGTLVGLQGALLLRRRARRQDRMPPPAVTASDALVVVVPTIGRHDTYPALERSVLSFVEHLPVYFTRFRADVVIEDGCEAQERVNALARQHPQIQVVNVPRGYRTPRGSRFKARANHYAHERRVTEGEDRDDLWVLHMDDDTAVGPDTAAAIAQFVNRQRRAGEAAKHLAQGILTYPRENAVNWLTWMADAVRPSDDFTRFRALTGAGTPVAGLHGELLLLRGSVEARIGWDFGPRTLVEDAEFALAFCRLYPGRSDWFNGRSYGASPATVRDFVRQRERWAWGLVQLALNRRIPLRHRLFLGWCVLTWVLGPLQHLGVVLGVAWALGARTSPVTETVLLLWITNFAYVIWSYWEGLRLNALSSRRPGRRWFEPFLGVLLIPLFALLEGIGGLRGLLKFLTRRENTFTVIAKPV